MGDITRGAFIFTGAAAATGVAVGVVAQRNAPGGTGGPEAPPKASLRATRLDGDVPLAPDDEAWDDADEEKIPLLAQQAAAPFLEQAGLDEVRVAALRGANHLGVRVRFDCDDPRDLPGLAGFGDAIAMQLPLRGTAAPPVTMGAPGQPVHIIRWTSVWQRDVDRGFSEVEAIYPNAVRDVSPQDILPPRTARLYSPGLEVGNPMSRRVRKWPVEEAFAEGFGSLTPLVTRVSARAEGRHSDGRWSVVIAAPLDRAPTGDSLAAVGAVPLAFAIWVGAQGNRGSRKHYTDWVQCTL